MRIRWPISIRRVSGSSMQPTLKNGQVVVSWNWVKPKAGRIVIARTDSGDVIKRIQALRHDKAELAGDNKSPHHNMTTDLRRIVGIVIYPRTP